MSLDVMYINKAEEIAKKVHNQDLQSSVEMQAKKDLMLANQAEEEPKGTLVNIPVRIKGVEYMSYVMRMGENMPAYNFWPRGREIIHRLIMRAAMTETLDELVLLRTPESNLRSILFDSMNKRESNYLGDDF